MEPWLNFKISSSDKICARLRQKLEITSNSFYPVILFTTNETIIGKLSRSLILEEFQRIHHSNLLDPLYIRPTILFARVANATNQYQIRFLQVFLFFPSKFLKFLPAFSP